MIRRGEVLAALAVGALVLGACGGSSSKSPTATTTTTATSGAPTGAVPSSTTGSGVVSITQGACSLATAAQVQAMLGAPASAAGVETAYAPAYKTCSWNANGPTGGNGNQLRLGVIRLAAGQQAFQDKKQGLTSTSVSGVGDKAIYSTSPTTTGFTEALFVADKGTVSVSIDVNFGGSIARPAALQDTMAAVAKAIFTQLGA